MFGLLSLLSFSRRNAGTLIKIAAVIFLISAGHSVASWVKKEAELACNLGWEKKINEQIALLELQLKKANETNVRLEQDLAIAISEKSQLMERENAALELQKASIPLSEACLQCRIDSGRFWLRELETGPGKGSGRKGNKTSSNKLDLGSAGQAE